MEITESMIVVIGQLKSNGGPVIDGDIALRDININNKSVVTRFRWSAIGIDYLGKFKIYNFYSTPEETINIVTRAEVITKFNFNSYKSKFTFDYIDGSPFIRLYNEEKDEKK